MILKKIRLSLAVLCILPFLCACEELDIAQSIVSDTVESVVMDAPTEVESVSTAKYGYSQLSDDEKICYDQILDCIMKFEPTVSLSTMDDSMIDRVFNVIFADYGELFWVDGYSYKAYTRGDKVVGIAFSPKYTMTKEERDSYQEKIDAAVLEWLGPLSADADDYTKAKFVFETLINRVDYDTTAPNNQNIISVFIEGATVCRGYASATSYMLEKLGIPSIIVSGTANGEAHAWNVVQLDGEYYCIDTTWGNSRYQDEKQGTQKHVNYAYLNVTSEELSVNHVAQMVFSIPECTATKDNYYFHEGLYFDTLDKAGIGKAFAKGYYGREECSSVKLAGSGLYNEVKRYFIDEQHIQDYCKGITSFAYIESEETCVLTIEWY